MSTNLSQQRRAELAAKIKAIHEYITVAKQDENTHNLLLYLADLEKEISVRKFGLVFEKQWQTPRRKLENAKSITNIIPLKSI